MAQEGLVTDARGRTRCAWGADDPLYRAYHDREWGRPVKDDHRLFEKLSLEGFQAGLAWITILRKRERFRKVFADFDPARVARFDRRKVERLLADPGIVRHRGKIEATIGNAKRTLEIQREFGSLAAYVWRWASLDAKSFAKDLKKRGFRFVGPTTAYAFMQAMGLVNDHLEGCFAREDVAARQARFRRPR